MLSEGNFQAFRIAPPPKLSTEKTPFEKMLAAKERATGCVQTMRGLLDKLENSLQPKKATTASEIGNSVDKIVQNLRDSFEELCFCVGDHKTAQHMPTIQPRKRGRTPCATKTTASTKSVRLKTATRKKTPSRRAGEKFAGKLPRGARIDLHLTKIPVSYRERLKQKTQSAVSAKARLIIGLKDGCEDLKIRVPDLDLDEMRFYREDYNCIRKVFDKKDCYWCYGYAVATYEKQKNG